MPRVAAEDGDGLVHLVPDAAIDAVGLEGFVPGLHACITPVALASNGVPR